MATSTSRSRSRSPTRSTGNTTLRRRRQEVRGQFALARTPFLDGDRVTHVVFVHTLNLQKAHCGAFVAHAEFLGDAPARDVARHDRGFEPMQVECAERVPDQHDNPFGDVAVPGERFVDPVTDVPHLERPPLHAAETDLTREATIRQEQPEAVRGVEVTLALPRAAT